MEEATIRLDKYLSNMGVCARREVKQVLKEQLVTVNGERVRESGMRIDPKKDDVRLNGDRMRPAKLVYYLLNKPKGVVSTTADEFGRRNVTSYIPTNQRIYPVGRLDKDTTGLIILTNDGELTNLLTHPRYHVYKVYRLTIKGKLTPAQLSALRKGVLLDDGITAPAKVIIIKETYTASYLEITIHEGRNRQIRRMCETVGVKLLDLTRIKFGPIEKGSLKEGKYRVLTPQEIHSLKKASDNT
jgi:23S rRNA pseudouridine2605 synthase